MSYKMVNPNTRIDWIPVAGLTSGSSPSAAQLNAGTRISPALVTGYTLKFSDSDVDPSKTVEDEGNTETPTLKNYEGKLTFFQDEVGTGTQSVPVPLTAFTTVCDLFKVAYVEGWLVSRYGRKATVAYAAGHKVSTFRVKNDYVRVMEGEPGNPTLVEVEFLPQGEAYPNVACVA
jgi:hypothetical protein